MPAIGLRAVPRRDRQRGRASSGHRRSRRQRGRGARARSTRRARAQLPTVDLNVTSYRVLSRDFSNDPFNIIERSRPRQRTDALLSRPADACSISARPRGGSPPPARGCAPPAPTSRRRPTGSRSTPSPPGTTSSPTAPWSSLTEAFVASQRDLRAAVEIRIRQGVSAEGDLARVDSYIAQAETRLAQFRRTLANAEARFTELTGIAAGRRSSARRRPGPAVASRDEAVLAAEQSADGAQRRRPVRRRPRRGPRRPRRPPAPGRGRRRRRPLRRDRERPRL